MSFGLTLAGFVPRRFDEIKADVEADLRAGISQNLRFSKSVIAVIIAVLCERDADLWEKLEEVFASAYPDSASGVALDNILAFCGIERPEATYSQLLLTLGGTPGTIITAGKAARDPITSARWIIQADATIGGGGTVAGVLARPEATGPIPALAGTITEIDTPVTGWDTVTNPLDAELGSDAPSDAVMRAIQALTMRGGGGSATEALQAALLRLPGVTECFVIENDTEWPDADGIPPHTIEAVVRGGADQQIFDTIWTGGKAGGISTHGNTTGATIDSAGDAQTVKFTRPTELEIHVVVEYEPGDGFPTEDDLADPTVSVGEAQIRAAILAYAETFNLGKDVVPFEFVQHIEVPNILDLKFRVGTAPNPSGTARIPIARRELAVFDSSRISFVRV